MKGKIKEWVRLIVVCTLLLATFLLCVVCFAFNITWDTLTGKMPTETKCAGVVEVIENAEN